LVELIIVIAIIAVLAVAAFMMLTKWLWKSRDSRRLWDLGTISRWLQVWYSDTDDGINMYPTLEYQTWSIVLLSWTKEIWYQWVVDVEVAKGASMQKAPLDPSDGNEYTYLVTKNRQKFQVLAMLEDGTESTASLIDWVYAEDLDYSNRIPTTKWFGLGVLLEKETNLPVQYVEWTFTGIDLTTKEGYKAIVSNTEELVWTWIALAPIVKEEVEEVVWSLEPSDTEVSDTEAPIGGDFSMPATTNSTSVELTITCPLEDTEMYISGNITDGSVWETCGANKTITLTSLSGNKTISMIWRDSVGNETDIINSIITYTAPILPDHKWDASNTTSLPYSAWQAVSSWNDIGTASEKWNLSAENGTVYKQSEWGRDYISLDTTSLLIKDNIVSWFQWRQKVLSVSVADVDSFDNTTILSDDTSLSNIQYYLGDNSLRYPKTDWTVGNNGDLTFTYPVNRQIVINYFDWSTQEVFLYIDWQKIVVANDSTVWSVLNRYHTNTTWYFQVNWFWPNWNPSYLSDMKVYEARVYFGNDVTLELVSLVQAELKAKWGTP